MFKRSKLLLPLILVFVLVLSACGKSNDEAGSAETITYQSESGPVEVPANPQRVVVLTSYVGSVIQLGVNMVGVDSWSKSNPRFEEQLKDVAEVSDDNLEKIIELKPDLIIGSDSTKNLDKLKEIAPTVAYTYNKVDYLTQFVEIGKLLNKEKEAQAWVDDFKERASKAGEEIKAKIGADSTVSVIENYDKSLYVFGDAWGRGTEILYQAMGLAMPQKVKEMTEKDGWYELSAEVVPDYMGDYVIFSKDANGDSSFQQTDTYKNTPAASNNHVLEVDAQGFYFNDASTLDYQLELFTKFFLGQ
ncbi:iron complex transport system substrate-binding protein [Paenibacillus cellulosilyticus]|uniref:Iron complex transport system substrate-binding protein n=1 Tax=Paenibacillus cellulosilyticus TaxID=375489 RepID=A0A2V2YV84_9BACL|nr:iron-hydroxamate ABC transporter substrate-binding protein [Paenibacillus cellulosilyticus]PWW05203.1 iron complex transport system substrate-binding protein [Paenibacillus cellulosilyticus]QKS43527.1 iron-hydroxamate ABC transporter substrate-binding protein [Paenibacillus cellulosilyticus]